MLDCNKYRFRALHVATNTLAQVLRFDWVLMQVWVDGEHGDLDIGHKWSFNEIRIFFSTGMKDMDGREIYDGDYITMDLEGKHICLVEWMPEKGGFQINRVDGGQSVYKFQALECFPVRIVRNVEF